MKYRLILYAFIITSLFNYVLGLRQSILISENQIRIDARSTEVFVRESKLLNHEFDLRDCVEKSRF